MAETPAQIRSRMAKARAAKGAKEPGLEAGMDFRVGTLEKGQGIILEAVERLGRQFQEVRDASHALPMVKSPEQRLREVGPITVGKVAAQNQGDVVGSSRSVDYTHPSAGLSGLQQNDVVRLVETSPTYGRIQADYARRKVEMPNAVRGVVVKFMHVDHSGKRKYRVKFEGGIGRDGCTEEELALVQAAV